MSRLDEAVLEPQLEALKEEMAALPRHPTLGYRGGVTATKLIVVMVGVGDDGKKYVADPSEIVDGHPDLAWREWITVRGDQAGGREHVQPGGSGGVGVLDILKLFTGGPASPGSGGGWLDLLKGLFGK